MVLETGPSPFRRGYGSPYRCCVAVVLKRDFGSGTGRENKNMFKLIIMTLKFLKIK
jgi:hypothetical protein